jgi:hypothetical protein
MESNPKEPTMIFGNVYIAPPPPTYGGIHKPQGLQGPYLFLLYLREMCTNSVLLRFSFMLQYAQQTYSCHKYSATTQTNER